MSQHSKTLHKVHHESETNMQVPEDQDKSFGAARIKYINLDTVQSVLFTKIEYSTGQRQTKIA